MALWTTCTGYLKNDGTCDAGAGGGLANVSDDTSPSLGGNLDGMGFTIDNVASINLAQGATGGAVTLMEGSGNGTDNVIIAAPDSVTTAYAIVLPAAKCGNGTTLLFAADNTTSCSTALGTAAYATIASYATLANPTFTGTVGLPTNTALTTGGLILGDASPDAAGEIGYSTGLLLYGENSEDLKIAVGSAANTTTVSSNTGMTDISFSALNLATTGTLSGAVCILDNVTAPTAAQSYGCLNIINAAATVTLPAAASGMSMCILSVAAAAVSVDVDGSDVIYLNGVALSAGDKVTSASAAGDFICLVSSGTVNWYTLGRSGTWTDGN